MPEWENDLQMIEIPRCSKCLALQIKLLKTSYEKCIHCNSNLELINYKEIKK